MASNNSGTITQLSSLFRLFGTKCNRCDRVFSKTDLVMRAQNLIYHVGCFSCLACDKRLLPGDQFVIKDDELYCHSNCSDIVNIDEVLHL